MFGGTCGNGAEDGEGLEQGALAMVVCVGNATEAALKAGVVSMRGHGGQWGQVGLGRTQPNVKGLLGANRPRGSQNAVRREFGPQVQRTTPSSPALP